MPHETTDNYERIRITDPDKFEPDSFRTHDIGKKGYSKRIAGRLKSTGKWATQSLLISINENETTKQKLRNDALSMKKRIRRAYSSKKWQSASQRSHRNASYRAKQSTNW